MIYVPKSCQVAGGTQKRSKLGTLLDATEGGLFHLWRTASVAGRPVARPRASSATVGRRDP